LAPEKTIWKPPSVVLVAVPSTFWIDPLAPLTT
jgi:hypothetical protein